MIRQYLTPVPSAALKNKSNQTFEYNSNIRIQIKYSSINQTFEYKSNAWLYLICIRMLD